MRTVPKLNINIPDHTILDKIGEGGMSAVYLGRQQSLQRKVAIKVLKKLVMEDKLLAERFVEEAKTVASLDHPHIISIYEAKKLPSGLAYFTMPYLTHGDFSEIICTNAEHLIDLLGQICDGLSHAHEHGVIHRDLKPENILFDQFGRIKIADFGIAISKKTQRKTKETQLLGSAHYMSPEQIQSRPINHRSDIYSLGCIIYEKITGEHVFSANSDFSILMSHINKPIPILPAALSVWQPIIDQCLAKDPDDRYQSVADLKADLMKIRYQDSQPEPDRQKSTQSYKKFIYPISAMAAMLAIIVVALLLFSDNSSDKTNEQSAELNQQTEPTSSEPLAQASVLTPPDLLAKEAPQQITEPSLMETVITLPENGASQSQEPDLTARLSTANESLKDFRLTKPADDNAASQFSAILAEYPDNQAARQGLHKVGLYYFSLINSKLDQQAYGDAITHIKSLTDFFKDYPIKADDYQTAIDDITSQAISLANGAIQKRRTNPQAQDYLTMSFMLAPNNTDLAAVETRYQAIPKSGDVMTDLSGHTWVFVTAANSTGVGDFWLAQSETSVSQFKTFAADQGFNERCEHFGKGGFFKKTWDKPPFDQTGQHPVICITAAQASAYAAWLSESQQADYQLPTLAQWQSAQQQLAKNPNCANSNIAGQETDSESKFAQRSDCRDDYVFTAPVKSLAATKNSHDLTGNVAEWVRACGNSDFCAAGGSWMSADLAATQSTESADPNKALSHVGFRLIKTID
ncbi:bifunctional serine/threonine-protein kinase/formylglycine-generating enzyme family protein [Marinicella gelatinilytica]|uniref:bifunctional serine/threonine-protein kinase/formylglycine-generating enzyme family protein n=1 Tax=Marinicella gelatinilytica TaxID=2996017 RepID=UPI002260847F|nr:bifunctional serine/threonine-protein kinase/formylglycine-generating enzyme family protein [Marinicella gelatinilytica]MCX7544371.1 bifunctional serine/threonine-protein kinase/formylglycine-generating enzyme family protein [Marinicella gelatinilytica]